MTKIKYSRQREAILRYLKGRTDHPNAEQIYTHLRREDPKLSLGTVYRNLALLEATGQIRQVSIGTGPDHYEEAREAHSHFLCTKCGRILDVDFRLSPEMTAYACERADGTIEDADIRFYGICGECRRTETGLSVES